MAIMNGRARQKGGTRGTSWVPVLSTPTTLEEYGDGGRGHQKGEDVHKRQQPRVHMTLKVSNIPFANFVLL